MTKKVIKACDICGEEYSYEIKPESPIPDWMIPDWMMEEEHFSSISFCVLNGRDKWNTNISECCPQCTKAIKNAFHQKVELLRLRR